MNRRRVFLTGVLVGLLLGAAAGYLHGVAGDQPAAAAPRTLNFTLPMKLVPQDGQAVPRNWGQYPFNGRTVYIVPLGGRG